MKVIHKKIRDNLFECDIHLVICTYKQLLSTGLYTKEHDEQVSLSGQCAVALMDITGDVIWINSELLNSDYLRCLVHEAVHVAYQRLDRHGITHTKDDNEMLARYTEYLVGSFIGFLPKGRK
jgi:hypothetical protein